MVKDCAFCAIMLGNAPATIVYQDEVSVAFLDKKPLFHGHVLLIPRLHIDTFDNLSASLTNSLFNNAQKISIAVRTAMKAQGTFIAINNGVSQSVPHLHIHIVPRTKGDGLRGFFWPRTKYESEEQEKQIGLLISREIRDS